MQEDQAVTFQPMYDAYPLPWFTKLFGCYLLFVLVIFAARFVRLAWNLSQLRNLQKEPANSSVSFNAFLAGCHNRAHSFITMAALTFLLSLLNFTWYVSDILLGLRTAKEPSIAFTLGYIGEALAGFSLALIFCIALYIGGILFESVLRRRQCSFAASTPDTEPAGRRLSGH